MQILILGGTGAMGFPLVQILSRENDVYVTSRKERASIGRIKYICGNAQNRTFLEGVLCSKNWDAVVDFMVRSEETLKDLAPLFLDNTKQYVFISSSRVYAETDGLISETTPRLLEASTDKEYLKTKEYALSKAREEDLLLKSGRKNYTIIRPTISYNTHRLQLGVLEKENWLYRALNGRSVVFSEDINDKITTMTLGDDVSKGISSIIGQKSALGEVFHITSPISLPWSEVLQVYLSVLKEHLGKDVRIVMTKKSLNLKFKWRIYQVIYCRYFNRTFDNSKISQYCDINDFTPPQLGLKKCLEDFLKNPSFQYIPWDLEALQDKASKEFTPLSEIKGKGAKFTYFCYRYNLEFLYKIVILVRKLILRIIK